MLFSVQQGFVGRDEKRAPPAPKNACVGGYFNPKRTKTWRFEETPRDLSSKML